MAQWPLLRADAGDDQPLSVDTARQRAATNALADGPVGGVGLELEQHVIDLDVPGRRPAWERITAAAEQLPRLPGESRVTLEPGGQLELSGPPLPDAAAAAQALLRDEAVVRACLHTHRLGLACIGADPLRSPRRLNPAPRYVAMEQHWAARGTPEAGAAMMCSTASVQVNLDAGPRSGWRQRVARAHRLGPVLVALSACSPLLAGHADGWRSQRQRVWGALDPLRCGPMPGAGDPAEEWADYALCAPVMLVGTGADAAAVRTCVPFRAWAAREVLLNGRPPTAADLDYHLTTLFPPVRLRGFLELRYLDAVPRTWWPSLVRLVAALLDDPAAGDAADEACEPVADQWGAAAREGLAHPAMARAAARCLDAAAGVVDDEDLDLWRALVEARRNLSDLMLERARTLGLERFLEEECRDER